MIFHGCCPTSYRKLGGGEQQKFIILKFLGLKVQNQGVSRVTVFPEAPLEECFPSSSSWWLPAHLGLWAAELICVLNVPTFTACVCVSGSPSSYGKAPVIGCRANPDPALPLLNLIP